MGFASGDELNGISIWAKAYVGEAKINKRGSVAGSDSDSRGVIMGVEKKLDNSLKVGAGMQYDNTDIDAYHRDIDVNSVQGFVYGEYKPNRWFVNGVAAYGQSGYKEKKFALGSKYTADYDVHIASLAAMTGYQFKYFTPEAGMRYYHIKQDGYTDGAGQKVEAQNTDILRAVLGTRVAKDFGRFRPEAYVGLTYDLMAGDHDTTVNLANGASYTVSGKRLARLGYEASAGLSATITDNITASLSYLGAYRRDYQEHTGMFNVKYDF
jgi:outer membrane autotransporter protein